MKRILLWLLILLVVDFLTACTAPTPTPVVIEREVTRLVTAVPPAPTALPTATAAPPATVTPVPTPTPTPEPTPVPTEVPTGSAGTAQPAMDVVYDHLTAEAQKLVDSKPALYDQRELASERYRGALNLVAQTCNGRCSPEMADAIAERTEYGGSLFYTVENRMIVDGTTGVNIPLLVATRTKAIADRKTVLDPMKPGWTLAVPGGYNKGVAEQITTDPAKIEALYQDMAFPISWWVLHAPTAERPFVFMSKEDMHRLNEAFWIYTTRPSYFPQAYENFMSMASDSSGSDFAILLTDGKKFQQALACALGSSACYDDPSLFNVWPKDVRQFPEQVVQAHEPQSWTTNILGLLVPESGSATSYDRLITVGAAALRSYEPEDDMKRALIIEQFGDVQKGVFFDWVWFYQTVAAHARLSQIGIPAGGVTIMGLDEHPSVEELAPLLSDKFVSAIRQNYESIADIPLQQAYGGLVAWMPLSKAWLDENRTGIVYVSITGNERELPTNASNGISWISTYKKPSKH